MCIFSFQFIASIFSTRRWVFKFTMENLKIDYKIHKFVGVVTIKVATSAKVRILTKDYHYAKT